MARRAKSRPVALRVLTVTIDATVVSVASLPSVLAFIPVTHTLRRVTKMPRSLTFQILDRLAMLACVSSSFLGSIPFVVIFSVNRPVAPLPKDISITTVIVIPKTLILLPVIYMRRTFVEVTRPIMSP